MRRDPQEWIRGHEHLHEAEQRAVAAAFEAAKEKSAAHNDLIRSNERQASQFVTRVEFDATRRLVYMGLGIAVFMPLLVGVGVAVVLR